MCLFIWLRIFQRQKKIAVWNFACLFHYSPRWASPILVNFGPGAAPSEACMQIAPRKNRTWLEKIQITPGKKLCRGSVGSRYWAPYGGICNASCLRMHLFNLNVVCILHYSVFCINLLNTDIWNSGISYFIPAFWWKSGLHNILVQTRLLYSRVVAKING